jgi:hypothetical protein
MSINITADGKRTVTAKPEWFPRPDGLERAVVFQPGYSGDRTADPRHSYGVHGMEITWFLRGPAGAVQFQIFTNWVPGELSPGHGLPPAGRRFERLPFEHYPMGTDLGYHSPVPHYEEQPGRDDCHILAGRCYYDGSGLAADRLVKEFVVKGEPAVWAELESYYAETLAGGAS